LDIVGEPRSSKTSRLLKIDPSKLKGRGILTPDPDDRRLAEEFRRIKRPLLKNAFDINAPSFKDRNIIMVTSAVAGEGKTYIAMNLAMSVAMEINHTVLLIDGDVTRRSMSKTLGIEEEVGLSDLLANGERDLADLLLKADIANLTVLPPGKNDDNLTELWASQRMKSLMKEVSRRYDDRVVIVDTPPLLADSSTSVLAGYVGQVVMVVEAEKTPRHLVHEALETISHCEMVGVVLNKTNQRYDGNVNYGYY
jgi:exopolysaccharide/PEP-CTERM locus tyrosine autokinase